MTPGDALAACEATVRRHDPDRYFAALFAPANRRALLFALYAFHREIARAPDMVREPMMAEIRLQWWREAVEAAANSNPPAHPAAIGLAEILGRSRAPADSLQALIDAEDASIASAMLMQIAASVLAPDSFSEAPIEEAGLAYGFATMLRAIQGRSVRGRLDEGDPQGTISRICDDAERHFKNVRGVCVPRPVLPAILPAALVPCYVARARRARDPLRERIDITPLRRQLVLLRAGLWGKI